MQFGTVKAVLSDGSEKALQPAILKSADKITVVIKKEDVPKTAQRLDVFYDMCAGRAGDDGYLVVPHVSSSFITEFKERADFADSLWAYTMPIYGVKNGNTAILTVISGMKWEYDLVCGVKGERYYIYPSFKLNGRPPYEDIVLEYFTLLGADANYAGIARRYREYQLQNGNCIRLLERIKNNAALKYQTEAINIRVRMGWKPVPTPVEEQTPETEPEMKVAITFDRFIEVMHEMKRQGVEKADICLVGWNQKGHDGRYPQVFPVEEKLGGEAALRRLIKTAKEYGYAINCHTNSSDAYRIADCWDEEYIIKKPDGSLSKNRDCWSGGAMYHVCPKRAYERFLIPTLQGVADLGFYGMHYIDVLSIVPPRECFDPNHPLNKKAGAEYFNKILAKAREMLGGVSSEGGYDYLAQNLDYALYAGFNLMGKDKNPLIDKKIPLWQLVYHGIVLSNPSSDLVNCVLQERAKLLKLIEFGGRPVMYYYSLFVDETPGRKNWMGTRELRCGSDQELISGVKAIKRTADIYKEYSHLQFLFMQNHEELADGVFKTTYEDGSYTIANYNNTEYKAEGVLVGPEDYVLVPAK